MAGDATRVMHLVGSGARGGANSYVIQLLRSIDQSAFALGVCSFGNDGPAFEEIRGMGVEACTLNSGGGYGPAAILEYFRHLKRGGYQILHAHVGSRVPRLVAHLAGCNTISHAHGLPESLADHAPGCEPGLRSMVSTAFGTGSDSIVACSDDAAKMLADNCPDLEPRLSVIRNGVDLEQWRPLEAAEQRQKKVAAGLGDSVVVGFAGRLVPLKRVDCVIAAAEHAVRDNPGLVFVILGDGPLRTALEERARALGDRIRFLGWQCSEDWLPLFDVLVLPSETEGLPFCILEAMACGVPVIASSVGGIPEAVVDGVTGTLVQPGDCRDLLRAIQTLASDPALRRRMGLAGRRRVEKSFDAHAMAERVGELYARLRRSPSRHA